MWEIDTRLENSISMGWPLDEFWRLLGSSMLTGHGVSMLTSHHHSVIGDVEDSKVSKQTILETCHKVSHAKTRQGELTCQNIPRRTYMQHANENLHAKNFWHQKKTGKILICLLNFPICRITLSLDPITYIYEIVERTLQQHLEGNCHENYNQNRTNMIRLTVRMCTQVWASLTKYQAVIIAFITNKQQRLAVHTHHWLDQLWKVRVDLKYQEQITTWINITLPSSI